MQDVGHLGNFNKRNGYDASGLAWKRTVIQLFQRDQDGLARPNGVDIVDMGI